MAKQIKHIYGSTGFTDSQGGTTFSQSIYTVPSGRIAKLMVDYISPIKRDRIRKKLSK